MRVKLTVTVNVESVLPDDETHADDMAKEAQEAVDNALSAANVPGLETTDASVQVHYESCDIDDY